jgi:2-hydroxychromene-2-carboxylate isomerase
MSNKKDFKAPAMPLPAELGAPTYADTQGTFLQRHWDSGKYSYRTEDSLQPPPEPLTAPVTAENPLQVTFLNSIRSPYNALMVHRCGWLQSNFNCEVTARIVLPEAIRLPGIFGGTHKVPSPDDPAPAAWYFMPNIFWDALRVAKYQGLDWYRNANPDPIKMDVWPDDSPTHSKIADLKDQPYILWMVRLACAAQLAGKSLDFQVEIAPLIWSDSSEHWPAEVPEAYNRVGTGMSYDETIKDIQANHAKYDAVFLENEKLQSDAGHGGIPVTIFRREPYYGQDRFDHLFYRLVENGLTRRDKPIAPFVDEPLRIPDYEKEREIIFGK